MTEHGIHLTHSNEPRRGLADDHDPQHARQSRSNPSPDPAGDKPKIYVGVLRELDELKESD
jgi:hypothetical protein